MKIDSVRKIAAILRTIAPEFKDKTDDDLRIWIELAEPYLSEGKYGKLYPQAIAYLTAHKMSLNVPASAGTQGEKIDTSVKNTMNVASFTEGSTSISFNNSAVSGGAASGDADAEYLLTAYGLQFLAIKKRCIVPVMIAGMKRM
jgi:hypothetical protein